MLKRNLIFGAILLVLIFWSLVLYAKITHFKYSGFVIHILMACSLVTLIGSLLSLKAKTLFIRIIIVEIIFIASAFYAKVSHFEYTRMAIGAMMTCSLLVPICFLLLSKRKAIEN